MEAIQSTRERFRTARILDGALATELEQRGVSIDGALWSARAIQEAPEAILAVHRDYLEAGADIPLTSSYQISQLGFQSSGLPEAGAAHAAARAMRRSVALALEARAAIAKTTRPKIAEADPARQPMNEPLIAASLGPYGAALANGAEFHGNYGFSDAHTEHRALVRFHAERIAVLAETEADLIAFETLPSLAEAQAVLEALTAFPQVAGWVSFTCRDAERTAHGEPVRDCAALLDQHSQDQNPQDQNPQDQHPQVLGIGLNCTAPRLIAPLLRNLRLGTTKPLLAYPNSGETWNAAQHCWIGQADVSGYVAQAQEWVSAGAQIVGGCCRTTPAHIRALRAVIA